MAPGSCRRSCIIAFVIAALLFSEGACTVLMKAMYSTWGMVSDGSRERFRRPYVTVFISFSGMALVGIVDELARRMCGQSPTDAKHDSAEPLESPSAQCGDARKTQSAFLKDVSLLAVPALCDLGAAILYNHGLMLMPASVTEMLVGSGIFFVAVFSALFLRRRILPLQWLGAVICLVGVSIVGLSSVLTAKDRTESHGAGQTALGVAFVVGSEVLWSWATVSGDYFLKDEGLRPMQVVGWQGFWGIACMCFWHSAMCLLHRGDHGHLAEIRDTWALFASSPSLVALSVAYLLTAGVYNACTIAVISELSGVQASMLEAMGMAEVWAFDLILYYFVDKTSGVAEAWDPCYDSLKFFGFVALIFGQCLYAGTSQDGDSHVAFLDVEEERSAEGGTSETIE